jgi:hypothetical protein
MPPIPLTVLDSLADDIETIDTMRNYGDREPDDLALVGETHILDALRDLLRDRRIEAFDTVGGQLVPTPVAEPRTDGDHLRAYWFGMTRDGKAEWEKGAAVLDAYWDKHPI